MLSSEFSCLVEECKLAGFDLVGSRPAVHSPWLSADSVQPAMNRSEKIVTVGISKYHKYLKEPERKKPSWGFGCPSKFFIAIVI